MADFLPLIIVGFAASLGLTPLTRQIARRIGLMDAPSSRKVHRTPIPLMGGLAIYGGFLLALLLFRNWPQYVVELGAILVGATWLAVIGFIDDRFELSPWAKFPAQALAALLVIALGIRVDLFNAPVLDGLLTFLWIVGIINAINFLDNMDGLAAGVSAIVSLFIFILAITQGQYLVAPLAAALCGSTIGFLIYNFNPATTFMGDMGSMVLGFVLAVLGIKLKFNIPLTVSWAIPLLVLGLPLFDTTLVVFTRLREGRSPLQGGKDHTSHRLVGMGLSHRMAVLTLYGVCILLGIAALIASETPQVGGIVELGAAIVGVGCFVLLEIARSRQRAAAQSSQASE